MPYKDLRSHWIIMVIMDNFYNGMCVLIQCFCLFVYDIKRRRFKILRRHDKVTIEGLNFPMN